VEKSEDVTTGRLGKAVAWLKGQV